MPSLGISRFDDEEYSDKEPAPEYEQEKKVLTPEKQTERDTAEATWFQGRRPDQYLPI